MKKLKSFIYGTIPYYCSRLFCSHSVGIPFYRYIHTCGYTHHLYLFRHEYLNLTVQIETDPVNGLTYVLHHGKKLYFPGNMESGKIRGLYKALVMEQDIRSPHHYLDSPEEVKGRTFLDIGSAEGLVSLDIVEWVDKIYLFECDLAWIEALKATFAPWKDKVFIVNKYISDVDDDKNQTLDHFLEDKSRENLFLKMDIEGAERKALKGGAKLFAEVKDLKYAICSYHLRDDEKVISEFLSGYAHEYRIQRGYVNKRVRAVVFREL